AAGCAIVATDAGAIGERVRRGGFGIVVENAQQAASELAKLCASIDRVAVFQESARGNRHTTLQEHAASIRALYESIDFPLQLDAHLEPEWLHELTIRAGSGSASGWTEESIYPAPLRPVLDLVRSRVPAPMRKAAK